MRQQTLKKVATCRGIGVHSGKEFLLQILPAEPNTGIVFERIDLPENASIAARWDHVVSTQFCTQIANKAGVMISTIEHLMAALAACEIDNAYVLVDGPELPIMDGSSKFFVNLIDESGVVEQNAPRATLRVLKPIFIQEGERWIRLTPAPEFSIAYTFDFKGREGLKAQTFKFNHSMQRFKQDIASARTFGFLQDAEKLYAAGLAQGASLKNTVVFDQGKVINQEGLRYEDECVRHKILDMVGDLYLAGASLQAHVECFNGGHELNNKLLRALFADSKAYRFERTKSVTQLHPLFSQPRPQLHGLRPFMA